MLGGELKHRELLCHHYQNFITVRNGIVLIQFLYAFYSDYV